MKVKEIQLETTSPYRIYKVTLIPNNLERFFGVKEKSVRYKETDSKFTFGGGVIYIRENGIRTTNGDYIGEEIDKHRRKF